MNFRKLRPFITRLIIFFAFAAIFHWGRIYINNHYWRSGLFINNHYLEYVTFALVLLFAAIFRNKIVAFSDYKFRIIESIIFAGWSIVPLGTSITHLSAIIGGTTAFRIFGPLYISYIFLFIAIFGTNFIRTFARELISMIVTLLSLGAFILLAEKYWTFFSYSIVKVLAVILPLFSKAAVINTQNFNVSVGSFHVVVGAPCAGFYSLLLFIGFFALSLFFVRKNGIRYGRAAAIFLSGFAILFLINVLRIAIIILVGAYYSPDLAISIFHEYLGSIFFLGFLCVYLWYVLPHMTLRHEQNA